MPAHPEDAEEAMERHKANLQKTGYHYFNHYRLKHLDGQYRHYEVYGYRKKNNKGETKYVSWIKIWMQNIIQYVVHTLDMYLVNYSYKDGT